MEKVGLTDDYVTALSVVCRSCRAPVDAPCSGCFDGFYHSIRYDDAATYQRCAADLATIAFAGMRR